MADGDISFRTLKLTDADAVKRICSTVYGGFDIVPIMCKSKLRLSTGDSVGLDA